MHLLLLLVPLLLLLLSLLLLLCSMLKLSGLLPLHLHCTLLLLLMPSCFLGSKLLLLRLQLLLLLGWRVKLLVILHVTKRQIQATVGLYGLWQE